MNRLSLALLLALPLAAQTLSLTVDNATSASGQMVTVTVSYSDPTPSANVAGLQWNLQPPPGMAPLSWSQSTAVTALSKSLECNGSLCLIFGGVNTIGSGPLASAVFQIPLAQPGGFLTWGITGALGSTPAGSAVAVGTGGAISVSIPLPMPPGPMLVLTVPNDKYCAGPTIIYTDAMLPQAYPQLRYAPTLTCQIPLPVGLYAGHLVLVEPNRMATGQRVMTISVQGQPSPPVDIFAAVGIDKVLMWPFVAPVTSGYLSIVLTGTVGNAVLSGIVVGQNAAAWDLDSVVLVGR